MYRSVSQFAATAAKHLPKLKENFKMKAWQLHEYGDINCLQLGASRLPLITKPYEVLVQVQAASVNPIDFMMIGGYGRTLFQLPRNFEFELPLTLGRDFSGIVLSKGQTVSEKIHVGDEVYGFVPLHKQGTFAEAVLTDVCHLRPKPKNLSHIESASLVYATMTAWSALFMFGSLLWRQREGCRVLILGASGGVGTAAVQLLKSQDCIVFGTCAENAVSMVYSLGADCVYNYNDPDYVKNVELEGRYHIILDCAKIGYDNLPKSWKYDTYITLNSPLLLNTDKYGLLPGLAYSASTLIRANCGRFQEGKCVKWGFFLPSSQGLQFIHDLISQEKLKPMVQKTYIFENLPDALKRLSEGHLRGKIVIDYTMPS